MSAGLAFGAKEPPPAAPSVCGQCPKFVPLPPDAANLGGPKMGECYGVPPATMLTGVDNRGRPRCIAVTTNVRADRAACALAELLGKTVVRI